MKKLVASAIAVATLATAASAAAQTIRVAPSTNLNPTGQTVTVIGMGFPASSGVQIQECTGSPLMCQVLVNVTTNTAGAFVTRVVVTYDLLGTTCSLTTVTGDTCLVFATETESPFEGAFAPISFAA
jgi:hypothetical protein